MPVTFQGSSFLLTYPRSNFDFDELHQFLCSIGPLQFARLARERHESGEFHIHAVVHYRSKRRLGQRAFDFNDRHPNVETVGRRVDDWTRVTEYVAKDGEFNDYGVERHSPKSDWSQVVAAGSREEAQTLIRERYPRDWIISRRNIDYALDQMYPVQQTPFTGRNLGDFRLPDGFVEWSLGNFA